MHILPENLRSALAVPDSTTRLRCSLFEQTALSCKILPSRLLTVGHVND
jgi:hypothetical protein